MQIIGSYGLGKINLLLNLIKQEDTGNLIDKIYLYAKDLSERKYQFLIKKCEDVGIKHLNNPNAFTEIQTLRMMFTTISMINIHIEKEKI